MSIQSWFSIQSSGVNFFLRVTLAVVINWLHPTGSQGFLRGTGVFHSVPQQNCINYINIIVYDSHLESTALLFLVFLAQGLGLYFLFILFSAKTFLMCFDENVTSQTKLYLFKQGFVLFQNVLLSPIFIYFSHFK